MARYEFLTTWLLRAPRDAVWDALQEPSDWPEWWRGVESVAELDGGDDQRVGSRYRVRWRSLVPYAVEFDFAVDRIERPLTMSGRASGDLEGDGIWRLYEQEGLTAVTYDWRVATTKPWMNALAPIARLGVELVASG